MSNYGLQIYSADGKKIIYDSNMVTWNQVTTFVGQNTRVTYSFPNKEMLVMYFFYDAPETTKATYLPIISYDTSKTTISPRYDNLQQQIAGLVLMR